MAGLTLSCGGGASSADFDRCRRSRVALNEKPTDEKQNQRDHREREPGGDVVPLVHEHLDADESEDDRQTLLQIAEPGVHVGEQEVQRP